MYVISGNGGDDTIAAIQWAHEQALSNVVVTSIDTGWAAPEWPARMEQVAGLVLRCGFEWIPLTAKASFDVLVRDRKNFPSQKFQWCAGFLKGLPLLEWLDKKDPACQATIILPKRRAASHAGVFLEESIEESEHHGDRRVWHALAEVDNAERDALVQRAGFELLHHRSLECDPCVNSRGADLARLPEETIEKVAALEAEVGKPMFAPASVGVHGGIHEACQLARQEARASAARPYNQEKEHGDDASFNMGCGSPFGCGL